MSTKPTPFDFDNPGEYLISAYRYQKALEPGISHRYLAAKMGYKSASAFYDLIKGRVHPDKPALEVMQKVFQLTEYEVKFLKLLFVGRYIRDPFYREVVSIEIISHYKRYYI